MQDKGRENGSEKGTTPQDRRFLYVDCIKTTTAALGVGVETIEPDHHLLNHLVTSLVAQLERAVGVGSRVGIAVVNPDVVRLPASSIRQVGSHERFSEAGSRAHAQTGDGCVESISRTVTCTGELSALTCVIPRGEGFHTPPLSR